MPWWKDTRQNTTLGVLLTHMIAETSQHLGQADPPPELLGPMVDLSVGGLLLSEVSEHLVEAVWRDQSFRWGNCSRTGPGRRL